MKISIVYFSASGTTEKAAGFIEEGIKSAGDIEVKLMNIADYANIDNEFINESSAVIFGSPVYVADISWQIKKFFDEYRAAKFAGKLAGAFSTANFLHGGADIAIQTMLCHAMTKGMLGYSSGSGLGVPFIHLGPVALREQLDERKEFFMIYGKRIGEKALELFS